MVLPPFLIIDLYSKPYLHKLKIKRKSLQVEFPSQGGRRFFHIEISQLRWFGHLIAMRLDASLLEVFIGRTHLGRPTAHWRDYISHEASGMYKDTPVEGGDGRFGGYTAASRTRSQSKAGNCWWNGWMVILFIYFNCYVLYYATLTDKCE